MAFNILCSLKYKYLFCIYGRVVRKSFQTLKCSVILKKLRATVLWGLVVFVLYCGWHVAETVVLNKQSFLGTDKELRDTKWRNRYIIFLPKFKFLQTTVAAKRELNTVIRNNIWIPSVSLQIIYYGDLIYTQPCFWVLKI